MTSPTARRAFLVGAPLAFAALLTLHPMGGADFHAGIAAAVERWLAVHFGAAVLFPLMAYVVWLLLRDVPGRAATVARIALPVYAVFYGVYETTVGIASGIIAHQGNGMSGAERQGVADAVNGILSNPIVGEPGIFSGVGGIAWVVAVSGAIVALRAAGVRGAALVLLGAGALMVLHIPPIGPLALLCLSGAAFLIERGRERASHSSRSPAAPSSLEEAVL